VTVADFYIVNHQVGLPQYDPDSVEAIIYAAALAPSLMILSLALLSVLPQSGFLGRVFRRHAVWWWLAGALMFGLYCLGLFVGLDGVSEMLSPCKLAIGVSAVPLLTLLLCACCLDARWWFSLRPGIAPVNSA
jgi:drug/metabolite transporter (DMT)-like permease